MKYAAVVLRNVNVTPAAVRFEEVASALLSGGVPLEEIVLLPYDDPEAAVAALQRLCGAYSGVFVICDSVLRPVAQEMISAVAGECLMKIIPTGASGRETVLSEILPLLEQRRGYSYLSTVIKTVFAPPAKVLAAVKRAQDGAEGRVKIHMSEEFGVGRIEAVYAPDTPKSVMDEVLHILVSELNDHVYAMEDVGIAERLIEALKLYRMRIATAESFTGGGISRAIVSVPGASKVFFEGLNTYDIKSKEMRLGVSEYTLRTKGAVSGETAREMVQGLLRSGHCDIAVSTTGIAGPDSDGSGTPVGTCFIAVGTKEIVRVFEYRLEGDRERITKTAINLALFQAYKHIGRKTYS